MCAHAPPPALQYWRLFPGCMAAGSNIRMSLQAHPAHKPDTGGFIWARRAQGVQVVVLPLAELLGPRVDEGCGDAPQGVQIECQLPSASCYIQYTCKPGEPSLYACIHVLACHTRQSFISMLADTRQAAEVLTVCLYARLSTTGTSTTPADRLGSELGHT